ncbi:MAG TPA: hypothetical protein VKR61_07730 [Bryobacteraceae bacterium]|nr:hypothetical protein [Bryobacteraceae bacterium]
MHTTADGITAALLAILVIIIGAMAVRAWRRSRISPDERERQRRLMLLSSGKMGDAILLDIHDDLLVYSYAVRGVEYTASQDISRLKAFLPADIASLGHVGVRYDPRNPANSIVVAEEWTGLQSAVPASPRRAPPPSPGT